MKLPSLAPEASVSTNSTTAAFLQDATHPLWTGSYLNLGDYSTPSAWLKENRHVQGHGGEL